MFGTSRASYGKGIYSLALLDFALVHLSMLTALAGSVTTYFILGKEPTAHLIASYFSRYYWTFFWPLSLLFPVVFILCGFYTRSRSYPVPYKVVVTMRGVGLGVLLFLATNYLIFRDDLVSRSIAMWFSVLATIGITAVRLTSNGLKEPKAVGRRGHRTASDERTVLVVGGAGYIGSILVRRLLDMGYRVRLLDSLVYGVSPISGVLRHPNLQLIVGDCRNIQNVVSAVKGAEAIVHLAAIVGDPACEQDRQTALETNYAATRMLSEVAKGYGTTRLIFASSCSVYGATDMVVDERSAVHPVSLYAQTKVDSEDALLRAHNGSFHPTILRLATVFGHSYRPRFDLVVNLLAAKAFQEGLITIFNGQQWRPFIHVRDVAEAFISVLEAPVGLVSGQIFNVGSSSLNYTLTDIAMKIRQAFPETRVEHIENEDRRNYRVSFAKIHKQLGFECCRSLEEGIDELKRIFEDKKILDYRDVSYDNKKYLQMTGSPTHADEVDPLVMAAFAASPRPVGMNGALSVVRGLRKAEGAPITAS